jgi:hypothetical protein
VLENRVARGGEHPLQQLGRAVPIGLGHRTDLRRFRTLDHPASGDTHDFAAHFEARLAMHLAPGKYPR